MNIARVSFNGRYSALEIREGNISYIKDDITESIYQIRDDNLKLFVTGVGSRGYFFSPATFNTSFSDIEMCMRNFQQTQMFILDFNGEVPFEETMRKMRQYNLTALFAYEIMNSQYTNGFRLVFLNDVPIKYAKVAEIMIEALLAIFPEADSASRDIIQLYSGGKKLLYFDESIPMITIELLFRNMCLYWKDQHGDNYRRKVYEFSTRTGIALNDKKYLNVSIIDSINAEKSVHISNTNSNESFSSNSILYKIGFGNKSSISNIIGNTDGSFGSKIWYQVVMNPSGNQQTKSKHIPSVSKKYHRDFRSADFSNFRCECQLLREFETGIRVLTPNELFGISTALISIDTGSEMFLRSIQKHHYFDDTPKKYSDWSFYLSYLKKTNCIRLPCDRFCPYEHQCHHVGNILSAKLKYHEVKQQANHNEEVCSADAVATELKSKFREVLSIPSATLHQNIFTINAPTGIGKSTMVLDYMRDHPEEKYIMAFPTVDLKNQNYDNAIAQGINVIKTPSLIEYKDKLPAHVWNNIQNLYQTGQYHAVTEYIRDIISRNEENPDSMDILKKHLDDVRKFYRSDCNVFTTHSMLSAMDYWMLKKFGAVIIDEDPLLNHMIANQVQISVSELAKALTEVSADSELGKKICAAIKAAATDSWIMLPSIPYDQSYGNISAAIDIPSFCMASKFYFHRESDNKYENGVEENSFIFFKPFHLNPRIKHIVLSATVDPKIYNYFFGANRVDYYKCQKAKYIGKLNQYTYYTASHAFIKSNPAIVRKMIKLGGTDNIISFKGEDFAMDDCYFGKTTGIDTYKGQPLAVLGTYHRPEWLYKLFVFTMGYSSFDLCKDAKLRNQDISYNGCRTKFMTYDKSVSILRDVQLWMIGSEQEQAVGRARLSRCDCTVTVFSNLPLSQANIIDTDYGKDKPHK